MPHESSPQRQGVSRREFGKRAAWAGLSAALVATPVAGKSVPGAGQSTPVPGKSDSAGNSEKETPAGDSEARYQQIIRRYGDRLSDEQRKRLRKILAYNEKLLAPIRSFPLDNGQPAATVLKFYEDASATPQAGAARARAARGGRLPARKRKNKFC
jgi:uncharacterized membrane protein